MNITKSDITHAIKHPIDTARSLLSKLKGKFTHRDVTHEPGVTTDGKRESKIFFQSEDNPTVFENARGEIMGEGKGKFIYKDLPVPPKNTPLKNRSAETKKQPENLWNKKPSSARGNL